MAQTQGAFSVRIEGLDGLIQDFKRAGLNYKPIIQQAMDKGTRLVRDRIRSTIVDKGITFQGSLGRSTSVVEATADRGVVGVGEKYGVVVEMGRRPGKFPPVAPIERWAALKLGTPGVGFLIARKIARQGTKAQPFVEPAFRETTPKVLQYFADATGVLVQMMAGK